MCSSFKTDVLIVWAWETLLFHFVRISAQIFLSQRALRWLCFLKYHLPCHTVFTCTFFLQCPMWLWGVLYFYLFNICLSSLKFKLSEYMCFILFTVVFLELNKVPATQQTFRKYLLHEWMETFLIALGGAGIEWILHFGLLTNSHMQKNEFVP